eukprot:COSAG06_NODE_22_length_33148_cov_102.016279_27_plen_52_part_00
MIILPRQARDKQTTYMWKRVRKRGVLLSTGMHYDLFPNGTRTVRKEKQLLF